MCDWLLVQPLLHCLKKCIELSRLDYGPGNDRELPAVETTDKVRLLLACDDLLELQAEPIQLVSSEKS